MPILFHYGEIYRNIVVGKRMLQKIWLRMKKWKLMGGDRIIRVNYESFFVIRDSLVLLIF